MNSGKDYEKLIEKIYTKLDSNSIIKRNDKLFGFESQIDREIDISITSKIGIHKILIIVQAKDYNKPVDVNIVGNFATVIKDVRANKGVLISAKGFTKNAITLAKSFGIETLVALDSNFSNWTEKIKVPIILKSFYGEFKYDFCIQITEEYVNHGIGTTKDIKLPENFEFKFTYDHGKTFFLPINEFRNQYIFQKLIVDNDYHEITYSDYELELVVNSEISIPAKDLIIQYKLDKTEYIKEFELNEFQGLINKITGEVNMTSFKILSNEFSLDNEAIFNFKEFDLQTWKELSGDCNSKESFKINFFHFPLLSTNLSTKISKVKI